MKLRAVCGSLPGSGVFLWISPKGTGWGHSWGAWKIEYAATVGHLLTRKSLLAGSSLLQLHFKLLIECCDWYRRNTLSLSNSSTYSCRLVRLSWPNTRRSSSNFNWLFNIVILLTQRLQDSSRTQDHTPATCSNDSKVAIPQTWDHTDTCVIKHDVSRKANIEDAQHRQLAVLDCVYQWW